MNEKEVKQSHKPGTTLVEISDEKLAKLLDIAELEIGRDVRLIKGLEIRPGAIIAVQYDR